MPGDFEVVAGGAGARFSLKLHRGEGMCLLAMNWRDGPQPPADFVGFAETALHPGERSGPPVDPTRAWVRKESLLKAYGLGLAVDPGDVRLDDGGLAAWDSPHRPPGAVWLREVAVPGHVAAVAVLPLDDQDVADLSATVRPVTT